MTRLHSRGLWLLVLILAMTAGGAAWGQNSPAVAAAMDDPRVFESLEGELKAIAEGPKGSMVLRADAPFAGRIDLKTKGIEPRKYDLLKLQVKADARAMLQVSLENYPEPGLLSHWYIFSKSRGAFDWETVYVDLHRPEEIKPAGAYKGLEKDDPALRGLRLSGSVAEMKRAIQPPGRRIWLGPVRFVQKAVDLDWDQRQAPYSAEKGQDLVFRYPLTVTNRLDRELTVRLELAPLKVEHAQAKLAQERVTLKPRETRTVEAALSLPAAIAAKKPPLYAERFLARAEVEGMEDSGVTVLRSSDPVELTVTVPIPEEKLRFPLLPRRKDLPALLTGFQQQRRAAEQVFEQVKPADLAEALGTAVGDGQTHGLYPWKKNEAAERYLDGLTAAAFLYDFSGDRKYLDKGTALLQAAAEKFPPLQQQWQRQDVVEISHGILAMGTLRLGWSTGSMRPPYFFQRHGMFNDFDLLAADMDAKARRRILDDFVLPAAVQMRNHCFGLGNQQDVVNYAILYAGLATRNWPLASFAYDSDYGLRNQLAWDFDDDGLAGEGHYHTPAVRPILYATELLHRAGVDLYDERLHLITHSPAAEAIGKPFRDSIRDYLDQHRFAGKGIPVARKQTDGFHLNSGVSLLRWGSLEVAMNWGTHIHRNAPDRMALAINAPERHPLRRVGGGNYTHSSLGQSILIVDESRQVPVPAKVTGYDIEGAVQFVQAVSAEHFPGTTITRTFALLGEHVLVLDRVRSDRARMIDWCLRYPGESQSYKDVATSVSLPLEHRKGSFTDKPNESARGVNFGASLRSDGYFTAATDKAWRQSNGRLVMAGGTDTQVLVFAIPASFSATQKERTAGVPVLMARRTGVRQTNFLAAFSPKVKHVVEVPVTRADGKPADAVGVEVTLEDGKTFRALANFEPEGMEVRLGGLKTAQRFATDYPSE